MPQKSSQPEKRLQESQAPHSPVRIITAASLFDGHDAAINIMRRLIQRQGAEVIHLGHNRSVQEIVNAAIQEDAHGIAVSSYQGGHVEYFEYMVKLLRERGAGHIRLFGGGGGVILPEEIDRLHKAGVTKIYSPEDGQRMGLVAMIKDLVDRCRYALPSHENAQPLSTQNQGSIARLISIAENDSETFQERYKKSLSAQEAKQKTLIIGITGTGGAGKSSLVDEWLLRWSRRFAETPIAVISIDPTRRTTGGALLGDRIRMNSLSHFPIMMRSMATRTASGGIPKGLNDALLVLKASGFPLIIVETPGIGQGDSHITEIADASVYVMTPEFGAPSQLEKIDMLELADLIVINKAERRGAEDAFRDVKKQLRRNRNIPASIKDEQLPVFGTIASQFNDAGVNAFFERSLSVLDEKWKERHASAVPWKNSSQETAVALLKKAQLSQSNHLIIPSKRGRYLSEISESVRSYHQQVISSVEAIHSIESLQTSEKLLPDLKPEPVIQKLKRQIPRDFEEQFETYEKNRSAYQEPVLKYKVRDQTVEQPLHIETLSGSTLPRIALPPFMSRADHARFAFKENLPGYFPFTAGVFPLKRKEEDPKRMFAGEGPPEATNKRFHMLCEGERSKRLSTAFDSVTLYGEDPAPRPDIYGKIGVSGVSVATLDDMKILYKGFDLCDPFTSVSMTINGPAPMILALFFNTAIDQRVEKHCQQNKTSPEKLSKEVWQKIKDETLQQVRGTVQADILKEDQAQNTCIFSTEFALKMMGDIQEYFVQKQVRNYYSVSISGYHIAEAGANPITQLALTLANGFTYAEYYLSRGLKVDDFAPNLSFFFSNGLDPEYSVIGRVARRIWAIAIKRLYNGSERSQKLKYHIQTSGRSLHAQEIQFNDIRTTLQALTAYYDHCNSLHTNAYDEAITTPTEESVRRAMAIQLIITREFGMAKNENPLQGSFIIEELTDLVEEAVLKEFDRLTERGGVLGAMETMYQRNKIQEESLVYETKKDSGELPIIGVNTYLDPKGQGERAPIPVVRSSTAEKDLQIKRCEDFKKRFQSESGAALENLKRVALNNGNIFAELMQTARVCTLGQMTHALYEVGGRYRRNM